MINNIPLFKVFMASEASEEVARVLASGYVAEGPVVESFEAALRVFFGSKRRVLAVNAGTSALDLALHLCGVGPGDEVISTPMTCTATNSVIVNRGARIVWADISPETGNIDPDSVERKVTKATRAIMAVDWGGRPCHYAALKQNGVPVIEDAAHAFGATYAGGPIADTGGDYVCFSFQAIKHLTTGDGGALVVPDDQYDRARKLRWFGLDRLASADFRYAQTIEESGYKYHMNDIAAAIGLANLASMREILSLHRESARELWEAFASPEHVRRVPWSEGSSWWTQTLLVSRGRDALAVHLKEHGIATSQIHARNDRHPIFPDAPDELYPGLAAFSSQQLAVPCGWWVYDRQRNQIIDAVRRWSGG